MSGLAVRRIDGVIIDLMAVSMTILTIVLALAGVYAFLNLRDVARREAREAAAQLAAETAERVANEYIQAELPNILAQYEEFGWGSVGDEYADDIAQAQED